MRIEIEDGIYHVMSRGYPRKPIVLDDKDRWKWTQMLGDVAAQRRWRVFAWVLMDTHYHVFVQTPDADLSDGMHDLNSGYVSYFNARHGTVGSRYRGRYKGILVEADYHYWELSRYIHLNPVRAGKVRKAEEYKWGSCPYYFGRQAPPEWLCWEDVLKREGKSLTAARTGYRQFLEDGLEEKERSPFEEAAAGVLFGSEGFVNRMKSWVIGQRITGEVPQAKSLRPVVTAEEIDEAVKVAYGLAGNQWRGRGKHGNRARVAAIMLCRKLTRMRIEDVGKRYGGVKGGTVSAAVKKGKKLVEEDSCFASRLAALEKKLANNLKFET